MDESRYRALTQACDRLLRAPEPAPARIANQWLHIRNEHPGSVSLHQALWNPAATQPGAASPLRHGETLTFPQSAPQKVDVLFISHIASASVPADSADFYFGDLPEQLAAHGITSVVALEHGFAAEEPMLQARLARGGATSRLVLPRLGTLADEEAMRRDCRSDATALRAAAAAARDPFERAVALQAAHYAETAFTYRPLRMHAAVRRLCERFRPRALVVLWEGLARERVAFHAARSVDPALRCIGYQHSVLTPRAHGLRRSLGKQLDPDAILCCGEVTAETLKADFAAIPVLVYGSHRLQAAARPRAADGATRCLVIPEGFESECVALLDFALAAAARRADLEFILRLHPLHPIALLASRQARFRSLPANVRVSDRADIAADFARCDWALYRGSSAAVHAVLAGVRPLYLDRPGELRFDPLHAMQGWRRYVATPEDFSAGIAADRRADEWEAARAFCERLVTAPDAEVARRLIAQAAL